MTKKHKNKSTKWTARPNGDAATAYARFLNLQLNYQSIYITVRGYELKQTRTNKYVHGIAWVSLWSTWTGISWLRIPSSSKMLTKIRVCSQFMWRLLKYTTLDRFVFPCWTKNFRTRRVVSELCENFKNIRRLMFIT